MCFNRSKVTKMAKIKFKMKVVDPKEKQISKPKSKSVTSAPAQLQEDNTDWAVARRKTIMRYQSFHV